MSRNDPVGNFRFLVEIEGLDVAGFREVLFPESRVEVIEYREGGDRSSQSRLLPGRAQLGRVVLKRGVQTSNELWEWWKQTLDGVVERRTGSIIVLNENREEIKRWNFFEGWPVAYDISDFDAQGNEVLIETLEIAHEGLELGD